MLGTSEEKGGARKKSARAIEPGIKKILLAGSALFGLLIVGTFFIHVGRIPFFTQNFLALVVLIVIGIQAYIYSGQWHAMQSNLERTDKMIENMEVQRQLMASQTE